MKCDGCKNKIEKGIELTVIHGDILCSACIKQQEEVQDMQYADYQAGETSAEWRDEDEPTEPL